jgi:hypothetical protein
VNLIFAFLHIIVQEVKEMKSYIKNSLYLVALMVILALTMPANAETGKITKTFTVDKGGTLVIESNLGSIFIGTWDRDEVSVIVKMSARKKSQVAGFEAQIEQRGNDVYIKGENEQDNRVSVEFDVNIPRKFNVDLKTGKGSIKLTDIKGNVKLFTNDGGISIGNVTGGNVDAHTSGDSVKVGNVKGDVEVDTSGGSIQLGEVTGKSRINESGSI